MSRGRSGSTAEREGGGDALRDAAEVDFELIRVVPLMGVSRSVRLHKAVRAER